LLNAFVLRAVPLMLLSLANCTGDIETFRAHTLVAKDVIWIEKSRTFRIPTVGAIRSLELFLQLVELADQLGRQESSHVIHAKWELTAARREERLVNECVSDYGLEAVFAVFMIASATANIGGLRNLSTTDTGRQFRH
jgi:hypothetical protein